MRETATLLMAIHCHQPVGNFGFVFEEAYEKAYEPFLRVLIAHTNPGIIQVCVVNTEPVPEVLLERYRTENAFPVEADAERIRRLGYQVVADNIISTENYVRHDSDKVAKLVIQLIVGSRGRPSPKGAS